MSYTKFVLREKTNVDITAFNLGMHTYMLSKLMDLDDKVISDLHNKYKTNTLIDLTKRVRFLQHTDIYKFFDAYKQGNLFSHLKNITNVKEFTKVLRKDGIFAGSLIIDLNNADQLIKIAFTYLMIQDPDKYTQLTTEDPIVYNDLLNELNLDRVMTAALAPKIK